MSAMNGLARASWNSSAGVSLPQHSPASAPAPAAAGSTGSRNHTAQCRPTHHWSHQPSHHALCHTPASTAVRSQHSTLRQAQAVYTQPLERKERRIQAVSMGRRTQGVPYHRLQTSLGFLGAVQSLGRRQASDHLQPSLQGQWQCTRQKHPCASDVLAATPSCERGHSTPYSMPSDGLPLQMMMRTSQPLLRHVSPTPGRGRNLPLHSTQTRHASSHPRAGSPASSAGRPEDASSQEQGSISHTGAPVQADTVPDRAGTRGAPRGSLPWKHPLLASMAAGQTDRLDAPSPPGQPAPASVAAAASPFEADQSSAAARAKALLTRLAASWQLPSLAAGRAAGAGAGAPGAPQRGRSSTGVFSTSSSSLGASQAQGMSAGQVPAMPVQNQLVSVLFLLLPALLCSWLHLGMSRNLLTAGARSFVQLTAIGFVLRQIFESDSLYPIFGVVSVMVVIAGKTAAQRAKGVPNAMAVATVCILGAATMALSASVWLGVVPLKPRFVIPIAGIVVGSTMTIAANTMQRLADDMKAFRGQVEAALALGATPYQSCSGFVRRAIEVGVGPSIDYTKTIGLIQLPGAMTGMIMGGASVTEAVALQIVLTLVLLGTCTLCCILAAFLSSPQFFVGGSLKDHWTT